MNREQFAEILKSFVLNNDFESDYTNDVLWDIVKRYERKVVFSKDQKDFIDWYENTTE